MIIQTEENIIAEKHSFLNVDYYAAQLKKIQLIPTSDFLPSTIFFWNELSNVHFYEFGNSILLIQLKPPFGEAFGHLLCLDLTKNLVEECKQKMKKLGVFKLKITSPNISENSLFDDLKLKVELDDFEYIYNLNNIALLAGSQYKKQRNSVAKAIKDNENLRTEISDLSTIEDLDELKTFCEDCMQIKSEKSFLNNANLQKEWLAFQKCLDMNRPFNLKILKLYANNILSGFIIFEVLNNEWIVGHFFKTMNGLGVYLLKELATNLSSQNFKYFNFQEDRGVASLRYFKQQLNPAFYLKSYSIAIN